MTRTLPHSLEAEESILGGIFLRNEMLAQLDALEVEDFYSPKHQAVFSAMRNLEAASMPIDPTTVANELDRQGKLAAVGVALLGEVVLHCPSPDRVAAYAAIVVKHRVTRETIKAASEIVERLYTADDEIDEHQGEAALQWAQARLGRVANRSRSTVTTIGELVVERAKQLHRIVEDRENGKVSLTGFPTGIEALDRLLGGWQPEIVSILGARPAMGKSSVLLGTADACSAVGVGVHAFVLEDSRASLADRAIARVSGVPARTLRAADMNRQQFWDLDQGMRALKARSLWIVDDEVRHTADSIVASVRRNAEKNKTRVAYVDYLNIVEPRDRRTPRHEQLDEIMTTFMRAAKSDGMAYVVGAQLNRKCEERPNKRPGLADLREAGAIEERAKNVVFLYRGIEYGPPVKGIDWSPDDPAPHNREPDDEEWAARIEFLIEKNSNGETGRVLGTWHGPTMRAA